MKRNAFKAQVPMGHKGPAIVYPFDPAQLWPERERHFIRGTLNGAPFEGEIGYRRRVHYTCVPDDLLAAARLAPGDVADVEIEPREPTPEEASAKPGLVWARLASKRPRRRK